MRIRLSPATHWTMSEPEQKFCGVPIVASGSKYRTEAGFNAIKNGVKRRADAEPAGRKPDWLRARMPSGAGFARTHRIVHEHRLATVCEESMCPNIGECWNAGTATIMVLGSVCTRACRSVRSTRAIRAAGWIRTNP